MKRRWKVNGSALACLGFVWFFAWTAVAAALKQGQDRPAPAWVWIAWWTPYLLPLVGLLLWALWGWARSANGWIVKRVYEPVTEDLRARAEK